MVSSTPCRRDAIRHNQNQLLYESVVYSGVGSVIAGMVVVITFLPYQDSVPVWSWYVALITVYLGRLVDYRLFRRAQSTHLATRHWMLRFNAGALLSSLAWASSMWLVFPVDDAPHQVLLVLTLGAVAGGALASLPYDRGLSAVFQLLIVLSVQARLLFDGNLFSFELALFSVFVFGFLLSCGEKVSRNYLELLRLKQDEQDNNLTLIKTTERMAQTGYWQWDTHSKTVELSENLAHMWGFSARQVRISDCFRLLHPNDRRRVRSTLESALHRQDDATVEHRIVDRGRTLDMRQVIKPIRDSQDNLLWLGTVQDITAIRTAEQTIFKMAYYDDLTELANRANFHERLRSTVDESTRRGNRFSVIYIDLDDFKSVNDAYGHECGDAYLKAFARHLVTVVKRSDPIARLGGDEFCVLLNDVQSADEAHETACRILEISERVLQIGNHRVYPRLSIGISMFPDDGTEPDQIVTAADLAMYNVKRNGKHDILLYHRKMSEDSVETARLESDFRTALVRDEFELWYQPQVDLIANRISGVEALIRWRHPERGLVAPDLFISLAERVGMISDIGEWVLDTACAQLADWQSQGYELQMAVNISGVHFAKDGFCDHVRETVTRHGLAAGNLEVEITESLSRDPHEHYRICHELRESGIRVAIDDFGTGYSSLSVLQNLGVDVLKIDRSFIDGLPHDPASCLLVGTIVDMALGLGYELVAEGVENEAQLDYLRSLDCTHVQGYFFSKPVPAEVIPAVLDADGPMQCAA